MKPLKAQRKRKRKRRRQKKKRVADCDKLSVIINLFVIFKIYSVYCTFFTLLASSFTISYQHCAVHYCTHLTDDLNRAEST